MLRDSDSNGVADSNCFGVLSKGPFSAKLAPRMSFLGFCRGGATP